VTATGGKLSNSCCRNLPSIGFDGLISNRLAKHTGLTWLADMAELWFMLFLCNY